MKNIKRKLQILQSVNCHTWAIVILVVERIISGDAKVLKKKWLDKWKASNEELYKLDLEKIETWSTYDRKCIDLEFSLFKGGKLLCKAVIWDGDSFNGHRTKEKFEAEITLPLDFIENIENDINYDFKVFCEEEYEIYLEEQKQKWMNDFAERILKD